MNLLYIDACLRQNESQTQILAHHFLDQLTQHDPSMTITHRNLSTDPVAPMTMADVMHRESLIGMADWNDPSLADAKQFAQADAIVIAAPTWDCSFPAVLRAYIERICVSGMTFLYTETGAVGLCHAKHLAYITSCGGFASGECAHLDHGTPFIMETAHRFGIEDCTGIIAEGLDIDGANVDSILASTRKELTALATSWYSE